MHTDTQQTLQAMSQTLERMDANWREAFERMDQRADERHPETITAIETLRRP